MGKPTISPDAVAQDQLKAFVRRIEALDDEIKVLNEDKSEVYAESKANGFDNKILRKVVAERRKGAAEREEQDALFQLYWDAIHGVAHAHVEIIEEFPPHDADGVVLDEIAGNGAGGAEDQAQVATVRASSSANEPQPGLRADMAAQTVQPHPAVANSAVDPESVESSTGGVGGSNAPRINSEPAAEGNTPTSAGHGDRGAVVPSAAPVVADEIARVDADAGEDRSGPGVPSLNSPAPVANDYSKPNPWCLDQEECGLSSWDHFCLRCQRVKAERQAIQAVQ